MSQDKSTTADGTDVTEGDEESQPLGQQQPAADDSEQADVQAQDTSENQDEETEEVNSDDSDESDDQGEFDIEKFAKAKGIDLANPTREDVEKLVKSQREAEKRMHEATGKQAELSDSISGLYSDAVESGQADASEARIANLEMQQHVTQFYINNPDARQYDDKMAEIVKKEPYLANNLNRLLQIARLESSGAQISGVAEKARRQERELLSKKQRAGINPSSGTKAKEDSKEVDPIMQGLMSNN